MNKYILFFCFCISTNLIAQEIDSSYLGIATRVYLDSLVVTAKREGFDVESFIQKVQEDKTFYQAFRNLRFVDYSAQNTLTFFDKKQREKAYYQSQTKQIAHGECRSMEVLHEQVRGDFYKGRKQKYRYYTAKMYDRVFFTHGQVCEAKEKEMLDEKPKGIDKYVNELKKLIFSPGSKVDVPLIGKKTAIFSEKMMPYYDYAIVSKVYKNGQACYVFSASVKPEFLKRKKKKTVIKYLETYFDQQSFQVVARSYQLAYKSALFEFDVRMEVQLTLKNGKYLPEIVSYEGVWDVPLKQKERCQFTGIFNGFLVP